jgi:hypothetical protein
LGPINDETIPLVEGLLKLHDFQLLTDCSQPYEHDRPFIHGKKWVEYQQRPYVCFAMPGDDGRFLEFFAMLRNRPEIVVHASELHPCRVLPDSHEEVVVSRGRIATTAEGLETAAWTVYMTCLCEVNEGFGFYGLGYYDLDAMKRSSAILFQVAASGWEALDLLGLIEEVAIECDLPRISRMA